MPVLAISDRFRALFIIVHGLAPYGVDSLHSWSLSASYIVFYPLAQYLQPHRLKHVACHPILSTRNHGDGSAFMRHCTYSYTATGAEAKRRVRKHGISWTTVMISTTLGAGMWASAMALGSHLSLPGSQDLHHSKKSGQQPLIRLLENINNYTPPPFVSHQDAGTAPHTESPAIISRPLHPPIVTELDLAPTQPFHPTIKKKPVSSGVRVHKNDAQGHANMGWSFLLKGRPQAAMAAYREALRHHPDLANAYVGMGITLKSMGNIEHAKQAIQRALELNPHLSSALVHLGYLYADGHVGHSDSETARRLFAQASQLGDPFAGIALLDLQSRNSKF